MVCVVMAGFSWTRGSPPDGKRTRPGPGLLGMGIAPPSDTAGTVRASMKTAAAGVALLLGALGSPVRAEVRTAGARPVRAKMPEPLPTESITDLDGPQAGQGGSTGKGL